MLRASIRGTHTNMFFIPVHNCIVHLMLAQTSYRNFSLKILSYGQTARSCRTGIWPTAPGEQILDLFVQDLGPGWPKAGDRGRGGRIYIYYTKTSARLIDHPPEDGALLPKGTIGDDHSFLAYSAKRSFRPVFCSVYSNLPTRVILAALCPPWSLGSGERGRVIRTVLWLKLRADVQKLRPKTCAMI